MTLLLGTMLFVVLGVSALVWTIVIDAPATAQSSPGAESEAIARRFYDALNSAVRTGDLTLLDLVAVTNSEHMPSVVGQGATCAVV